MSDIVEIIKKQQLNKLARSESFAKAQETSVNNKVSTTKYVITGKNQDPYVGSSILYLRDKYYNMLRDYSGSGVAFAVDMNKKSVALWSRVDRAREAAGCDPDRYLKAQFVWFDKTFGKAPSLEQLSTASAVERAIEFSGSTKGKVLGNERKVPISKVDIFREAEKTLQQMLAAQKCDRADFYRKFVLTGLFTLPKEFLSADPTYQRVISE